LIQAAKREGRLHTVQYLRIAKQWQDFRQYAACYILATVQTDPLWRITPWSGFTYLFNKYIEHPDVTGYLSPEHRPANTNGVGVVPYNPRTVSEFVQGETDLWAAMEDRALAAANMAIARERFGNDPALLYLAGEVTHLEAARLLAHTQTADQVDIALALVDAREYFAAWWGQQL
jgi:hypothetical protein